MAPTVIDRLKTCTEVTREISITPSLSGLRGLISAEEWQQVVGASVARWNQALEHCCDVRLTVAQPRDNWLATEDGMNVIILRSRLWCHNESCGHTSTFPPLSMAMTTTIPQDARGTQVREADVEVNGTLLHAVTPGTSSKASTLHARATQSGLWVLGPTDTQYPVPLEAVLVHELGHVLGMDDACVSTHAIDGTPIPGECPPEQRHRVMFPDGRQLEPTEADLSELAQAYPLPERGLLRLSLWLLLAFSAILIGVLVLRKRCSPRTRSFPRSE